MNSCLHCQRPSYNEKFCCNGCQLSYKIINNSGFSSYYQKRLLNQKNPPILPEEFAEISDIDQFIDKDNNGNLELNLIIQGIHCAACIWLIENILQKQTEITSAKINFTSKRICIKWRGEQNLANDFIKKIYQIGYKALPFDREIIQQEEKKYNNKLLKYLAVSGFAAGNVMLISIALWSSNWLSMGENTRTLLHWVSAFFAVPATIYSGRIFFISAFKAIKNGSTNMDVPISVALLITSIISISQNILKAEHSYFDSVIMLVFFLLIGRYLEFKTKKKAFEVVSKMTLLSGKTANLIDKNGEIKIILTKDLKPNMTLLVKAGDNIPADGIITDGETEVDNSILTGETKTISLNKNKEVFAGMVNITAPIKIKITKKNSQSLISQIISIIENVTEQKGEKEIIAQKIAKYYTPIVHILAFITFIFWFWQDLNCYDALLRATAVLIVTCPCALALAIPIVRVVANGNLFQSGILVKDFNALEKISKVKNIIFDKTGTLTTGRALFSQAFLLKNGKWQKISKNHQYLQYAFALAQNSNHPISNALAQNYNKENNLNIYNIKEKSNIGISGKIAHNDIFLGKLEKITPPNLKENQLITYFKYNSKIISILLEDKLRDDAKEVINYLKNAGKNITLISGDKQKIVTQTAKKLNILRYFSQKNPIEKFEIIQKLKNSDGTIMIGDGINDAAALKMADVSISPTTASDISKNCSDLIFQGNKLSPITKMLEISKKSQQIIWQNFALSFAYNIIIIPFAFLGFVSPFLAAASMSASSILVTLNSMRMK